MTVGQWADMHNNRTLNPETEAAKLYLTIISLIISHLCFSLQNVISIDQN